MADPLDKRYAKYKAPFMKDVSGNTGRTVKEVVILTLCLFIQTDLRSCP